MILILDLNRLKLLILTDAFGDPEVLLELTLYDLFQLVKKASFHLPPLDPAVEAIMRDWRKTGRNPRPSVLESIVTTKLFNPRDLETLEP